MSNITIHRQFAQINGVNIFYFDTLSQGEVILCLHGRWGRAETWVDFIHHYGYKFRIIAPDQRGHGLSDKPISNYSTEEMATDMIALLDSLAIKSAFVIGHSMGGGIAGYLAANYPQYVKALAILDKSANGPDVPGEVPMDPKTAVDPATQDWPLPFASLTEAREYIHNAMDSDLSREYFMNSLVEEEDGWHMLFSAQAMAANIASYQGWFDLLPRIKCPVLLVRSGSHEAVPDSDFLKMMSLLPDCLSFEMSKPDHNVHLSNKPEFYGYFDKFLRRCERE